MEMSFHWRLGDLPYPFLGTSGWDVSAITLRRLIKSSVHLAIGPRLSLSTENGNPPSSDTVPGVVRKAYSAARIAGLVKDPLKSAPIEIGANPALTPTAEPVDDPDGFCKGLDCSHRTQEGVIHRMTKTAIIDNSAPYICGLSLAS